MAEPRTNLRMADFVCFGIVKHSTITENKLEIQGDGEGPFFGPFSEGLKRHFLQMYGKV